MAEADVAAEVEGGGARVGGAVKGNGDGPARVEGNGAAEAKCDSAAHGVGAQADRAAQAEADSARALTERERIARPQLLP